jgi:hypothetical protein
MGHTEPPQLVFMAAQRFENVVQCAGHDHKFTKRETAKNPQARTS